jgi:hypothetical protein
LAGREGFSNAEVRKWKVPLDKGIHQAITKWGWWETKLLSRIDILERLFNRKLNATEVRTVALRLLAELDAWSTL